MKKITIIIALTLSVAAFGEIQVPKPAGYKKTRILTDANLSPIRAMNPRWFVNLVNNVKMADPDAAGNVKWVYNSDAHDFMVSIGYEEAPMIYNGTLNLAQCYAHIDSTGLVVLENDYDLSRGSGSKRSDGSVIPDYCDPVNLISCRIVGELTKQPRRYGNTTAKLRCPLIFDLEGNMSWMVDSKGLPVSRVSPEADRIKVFKTYTEAINAIKWQVGDNEVWVFGEHNLWQLLWPDTPALIAAAEDFKAATTATCGWYYLWDRTIENPNHWLGELANMEEILNKWQPHKHMNKVLVTTPTWVANFQNDAPEILAQNNKAIPMRIWKPYIDKAVDEGFWIYVWTGNLIMDDDIKANILYVAQYRWN